MTSVKLGVIIHVDPLEGVLTGSIVGRNKRNGLNSCVAASARHRCAAGAGVLVTALRGRVEADLR